MNGPRQVMVRVRASRALASSMDAWAGVLKADISGSRRPRGLRGRAAHDEHSDHYPDRSTPRLLPPAVPIHRAHLLPPALNPRRGTSSAKPSAQRPGPATNDEERERRGVVRPALDKLP